MTIREAEEQDFSSICTLMKNELGYSDVNEAEAIKRLGAHTFYEKNGFEKKSFHSLSF